MALTELGQWHAVNRRRNTLKTFTTLFLVLCSFWIPISDAAPPVARDLQPRAPIADGVDLRVLPIGDSITWGAESSDENGYRKRLFGLLADRGNAVDFVGNVTSGTMSDDHHEGHRGFVIRDILIFSGVGIHAGANVVLLHAGTNDFVHLEIAGSSNLAPTRLERLIDTILEYSPEAVVLVCQIIPANPSRYPTAVPLIETFNEAIPDLVAKYVAAGKKMLMVSMNKALSTSDLADGLHPNDGGYAKMADAYYDAIVLADKKGWISEPGKATTVPDLPDATSPDNCKSTPSWYKVGQIANGAKVATSDGPFIPSWVKRGVVAKGACPRARLHFMDLDGDGLKDYACVDPKTGAVKVHINIPDADGNISGNWKTPKTVVTPTEARDGYGVMFADLNGDGRDDYIYIDPKTGDIFGWINRLEKDGVWQWQALGRIAGGVGAKNDTLQLLDIDGDGRADFCLVSKKTGEVTAWLNTGASIMPDYHKLGIIATGSSQSDGDTVILGDLTGEGRADYMIVGVGGKVNGLINRRQETSLAPRWSQLFNIAEGPDGARSDQVRLVDITGDGKVDYLLVDEKTGEVTLWENRGTGGKYQPGDGVFLCDLDGDGTSDYFWIDHTGKGWGYLNTGKGENKWNDLGLTAKGDHPREQIRMGVLTKSGRADYIVVDEKTGRADWFENLGKDGGWGWTARGEFATGPKNTIETQFGMAFKGKNVRFADLNSDGLDDYLYVSDTGAVVMWPHRGTNPPTWGIPKLVADGVGVLAQDVQFADTNGDGRMDYVVVSRTTGRTRSWHNLGFREDGSIRWNTPLNFADGVGSVGTAISVTEMTGDKRADYVSIDPDNGRLNLWHNRCWPINSGGGDSGDDGDGDNEPEDPSSTSAQSATPVYLDPKVYQTPQAKCQPPCVLVFPPSSLSSATTISIGSYTTSLEYGAMDTTIVSGKEVTTFVKTTTTLTVSIPPVTVSSMTYSNVKVTKGQPTRKLTVNPSITIKPIPVKVPDGNGKTTTRTITPPPWPAITGKGSSDEDPGEDPNESPTSKKTTIKSELPTWTTWPPHVITPIPEHIDEIEPDDDGTKTPCNLWFFSICINWGKTKIGGLRWTLPPGIYPPGPPPRHIIDQLPDPGWTIKPPLPPWPPITVGHDGKITYSEEPDCKTESASLCSTTTFRSEALVGPSTSTVTKVSSDCETIYGCSVSDWESATDKFTSACPLPTPDSKRDVEEPGLGKRQFVPPAPGCPAPAIVYPRDPENVGEVPDILNHTKSRVIESSEFNFVAFYWVPMLDRDTMAALLESPDVDDAYYYEEWNANTGPIDADLSHDRLPVETEDKRSVSEPDLSARDELDKRERLTQNSPYWALAQISLPYGKQWKAADSGSYDDTSTPDDPYLYQYDDSAGQGQFVYIIHEYGYWSTHPEFANTQGRVEVINPTTNFGPHNEDESLLHGSGVGAMVLGDKLGLCKKCTAVYVTSSEPAPNFINQHLFPRDRILQQLIDALDDIKRNRRQGKVAINMSFGFLNHEVRHVLKKRWFALLKKLETNVQAVLVVSSGNGGRTPINRYPQLFAGTSNQYGTLSNMIVVGSSDEDGHRASSSQTHDFLTIYAPGVWITGPSGPGGGYAPVAGTSYAAPRVAALVAYFRSMPSPWQDQLQNPANVKKLIQIFGRTIIPERYAPILMPIIWNGQVGAKSCLRDYATKGTWDTSNACPTIKDKLEDVPVNPCRSDASKRKRQDVEGCPVSPPPGDGGSDDNGLGKEIDWTSGQASPKCPSGTCGGKLCDGYYCISNPSGHPPDFYDPKNPDAPNPGTGDPNNPSPEPGWDDGDDGDDGDGDDGDGDDGDGDDGDGDGEPSEPSSTKYKIIFSTNKGHTVFDPASSSSFKKLTDKTWKISYGDGSSASGDCGSDDVIIGGLTVKNQIVKLASQLVPRFAPGDTPKDSQLFTSAFYSERDANSPESFYTFGYIDDDLVSSPGQDISWANIDSSQGFWMFPSAIASVNGNAIELSGNTAIADTGTTLALVSDQQSYVFPTSTKVKDLLEFKVAVGDKKFVIQPEDLAFAPADNNNWVWRHSVDGNFGYPELSTDCFYGDKAPVNCFASNSTGKSWQAVEDWFAKQCPDSIEIVELSATAQCARRCIRQNADGSSTFGSNDDDVAKNEIFEIPERNRQTDSTGTPSAEKLGLYIRIPASVVTVLTDVIW
ncbi:Fc.00g025480.m01.CDS01 [Cosmosporella sp. VM-42]